MGGLGCLRTGVYTKRSTHQEPRHYPVSFDFELDFIESMPSTKISHFLVLPFAAWGTNLSVITLDHSLDISTRTHQTYGGSSDLPRTEPSVVDYIYRNNVPRPIRMFRLPRSSGKMIHTHVISYVVQNLCARYKKKRCR